MAGSKQQTRPFAMVLLLFSLIAAGVALFEWQTSSQRPKTGDLRFYSGIVESVRYTHSRLGRRLTGIRFRIEGAAPELLYAYDSPSFRLATSCLLRGSSVTAGVVPSSPFVWQLSCNGKTLSDISSTAQSHREKGRRARNIAIVCGLVSLCWIWWTRGAAQPVAP